LIAVLYRSGCVVNEALNLRLDDVDLERLTLRFESGRQATRTVGMDARAFEILEEWLALHRELPGDLAFCTFTGRAPGSALDGAAVRTTLYEQAIHASFDTLSGGR
jgi:integrase